MPPPPPTTKVEWRTTNHRNFRGDEIEISTKLNSSRFYVFLLILSFHFIPRTHATHHTHRRTDAQTLHSS